MKIDGNTKDEDLVVYTRETNKEYFSFIIDRYEKKLKSYMRRFVGAQDDVDDLMQDVFVKVFINLNNFDKNKKFSSWIYRIAHNSAINWIKKKKAEISIDSDEIIRDSLVSEMNVLNESINNELAEKLETEINKLPNKYKIPFILKFLEGKSYQEISDILRISKNVVGVRINRAKKIMKRVLEKTYEK